MPLHCLALEPHQANVDGASRRVDERRARSPSPRRGTRTDVPLPVVRVRTRARARPRCMRMCMCRRRRRAAPAGTDRAIVCVRVAIRPNIPTRRKALESVPRLQLSYAFSLTFSHVVSPWPWPCHVRRHWRFSGRWQGLCMLAARQWGFPTSTPTSLGGRTLLPAERAWRPTGDQWQPKIPRRYPRRGRY